MSESFKRKKQTSRPPKRFKKVNSSSRREHFDEKESTDGLNPKDISRVGGTGKLKRRSKNPNRNPVHSETNPTNKKAQKYIEKHKIIAVGPNVPDPITTFADADFPKEILDCLKQQKFTEPTPIQAQGWPIALRGQDLVGIAPTGSGKTLAFILPAILHIVKNGSLPSKDGPPIVILVPNQELGDQIKTVAETFCEPMDMKVVCLYSIVQREETQMKLINTLKKGEVHICISTPVRFLDFLDKRITSMKGCSYLIVDEATKTFELKYEMHLRKIMGQARKGCQFSMWSATWTTGFHELVGEFLKDYIQIHIGALQLAANTDISQIVEVVTKKGKLPKLEQILEKYTGVKTLVFSGAKVRVKKIAEVLQEEGLSVLTYHADLATEKRTAVLDEFKRNGGVLIATDLAARGIDIDDIDLVVNFDFPPTLEEYVHRVGRTGRKGRKGTAITLFCDPDDVKHAPGLISILKASKQVVKPTLQLLSKWAGYDYGESTMEEIEQSKVDIPAAAGKVKRVMDETEDVEMMRKRVAEGKCSSKKILMSLFGSK